MKNRKGEFLSKDSATMQAFNFIDDEKGVNQLSREVYKKLDQEVHYPRAFDGGQKYKSIKKITYRGFKGKLPVGVFKSVNYGYGFNKTLKPFARYLNDKCDFEEVIIEKNGKTEYAISKKVLYLSEASLRTLNDTFGTIFKKNNSDVQHVLASILHSLFPTRFKKIKGSYTPNTVAAALSNWGNALKEFSQKDKDSIKDLFEKLSITPGFFSNISLAQTKEIIDNKYIKDVLKKFDDLMKIKKDGKQLEKKWQQLLREHNWIFSYIFAQPLVLYKDEAYVGGKAVDNKDGKLNDFLIQNSISENVSFLEIKTHISDLVEKIAYRGTDVFGPSKELSGAIVQTLNQRDNFQKEFYSLKDKSVKKGMPVFESINSKCIVLVGSYSILDKLKKSSFELIRNNSRDVELITFDELRKKIENLQKLLKK